MPGKPFEKGHQKKGGRQPGSPNKMGAELRAKVGMLREGRWDELIEDLESLDPRDRCRVKVELMQYALPKLSSVEYKDKDKPKTQADELDEISGEKSR